MGPLSPSSGSSHLSPKPTLPNLNHNPFSPLSPHLLESRLADYLDDQETEDILGSDRRAVPSKEELQRKKAGSVIYYSRERLLRIGKRYQANGRQITPRGMGGLETWYGMASSTKSSHLDDPAIASIGPVAIGSGRRGAGGGFGEGFGFGGGIGVGRGIGKGGRNVGLRRPTDGQLDARGLPLLPDDRREVAGGQMGRFSVKNPGDRHTKLGGNETVKATEALDRKGRKDDGEWRRAEKASAPPYPRNGENSRRPQTSWNNRQAYSREDEPQEPAWMDDHQITPTNIDPAIAETADADPLIQFIPGEDMIAAHKRAMKARDPGGTWRVEEKPMLSFFGADPAVASTSNHNARPHGLPHPMPKTKVFNAADYLRPSKANLENESDVEESASEPNAFQSRFQRFFGASAVNSSPAAEPTTSRRWVAPIEGESDHVVPPSSRTISSPPADQLASKVDDRMAKLMGLLSKKESSHSGLRPSLHPGITSPPSNIYPDAPGLVPVQPRFQGTNHHDSQQRSEPVHLIAHLSSPSRPDRSSGVLPTDLPHGAHLPPEGQKPDPRSFVPRPPQGFGPPNHHPNALLQQLQSASNPGRFEVSQQSSAPDMQLHHAQHHPQTVSPPSRQQSLPPGMLPHGFPPGFRSPPHMYQLQPGREGSLSPHDLLRDLQQTHLQSFPSAGPGFGQRSPNGSFPLGAPRPGLGYLPPHYPPNDGPRPPPGIHPSGPAHQHRSGQRAGPLLPPGLGQSASQLGVAQQDVLATLFAGLGPQTGGGN